MVFLVEGGITSTWELRETDLVALVAVAAVVAALSGLSELSMSSNVSCITKFQNVIPILAVYSAHRFGE